jgi:hypothetical protein
MLMDDAVILATTRQSLCLHKLHILGEFRSKSGMIINQAKTKFIIINGKEEDRQPLQSNNLVIENCQKYIYLGAVITQDGNIASSERERTSSSSRPTSEKKKHRHALPKEKESF